LTRSQIEQLHASYTQELSEASKRVRNEPPPAPSAIWDYVFADKNYVGGES
jgi:TPP-dependent pyruvate/acetoin dehydrogenase alpha subunit